MDSKSIRAISAAIVFVGACILITGSLPIGDELGATSGCFGVVVGAVALIIWMSALGTEVRPPGGTVKTDPAGNPFPGDSAGS